MARLQLMVECKPLDWKLMVDCEPLDWELRLQREHYIEALASGIRLKLMVEYEPLD